MTMKAVRGIDNIMDRIPDKDCGMCGFKTCSQFGEFIRQNPEEASRCSYLAPADGAKALPDAQEAPGHLDIHGLEFDFMLEKLPGEPGPRETILPFNPAIAEKLGIKKGDYLTGRPSSAGCPVAHCGVVVEGPDPLTGALDWFMADPLEARRKGVNIGMYFPIAYEGIVLHSLKKLEFGKR